MKTILHVSKKYLPILLPIFIIALALQPAMADDYRILVAPKDTPAYENAKNMEDDVHVFAQRKFHKALRQAAELLASGNHRVFVMVAAGTYTGKAGQGVWEIPPIDNPEGTLELIGGWNEDFTGRQPFGNIVNLETSPGRNGGFIQVGRRSALKKFVVSGFLMDAAPSNAYDTKTNSILKGRSRTYTMLMFKQLKTEHLIVDSNIFINGAHGAFDPFITPVSPNTIIDITNNFIINTIKVMKTEGGSWRGNTVKEINIRNNSFLLNWPYNADPTSALVGCLNLHTSGSAQTVNIEENIFAYNPGGAMQQDWPEERMPEMNISSNLFYMNAALFGEGASDAGVIVGKFGLNPSYLILDIETIEDDFDYDFEDNVSMDPQIPITFAALQAGNSNDVTRDDTVMNDVRRMFGLNQSGSNIGIGNYAPRMKFNPGNLPLPQNAAAKAYGVQPMKLYMPR